MRLYDATFILNPQSEEANLDTQIKDVQELIVRYGGRVVQETRLGMRRLAYHIGHLMQGYYVNIVFEGTGDTVREMERHLRLSESCLRFLTCLYEPPTGQTESLLAAVPESIAEVVVDDEGEERAR